MNRTVYLDMDDLVGNLFITLRKSGIDTNRVSLNLIENYKNIITDKLIEKNITPKYQLSRDDTRKFLYFNRDMYRQVDSKYIDLINNKSTEELIDKYHGYLSLDVLLVLLDADLRKKAIDFYKKENDINKEKVKVKKL